MKENTEALSALERLKQGNQIYLNSEINAGDVSPSKRADTYKNGQHPYAVVVSCADSRVIPEAIFSAGIGDLFVIRVAGNVVGNMELASIDYAVEHLGCKLVLVLGHTGCGAVNAALHQNHGLVTHVTDEIQHAIGSETNAEVAVLKNVVHSVCKVKGAMSHAKNTLVIGAIYDTCSGDVIFLSEER